MHLRGVTECTLLVFRLCATGLGLPGATPPPVSRGACRHGQFHYQRLELSSSEVLAAVLRGVSVAPLSVARNYYANLQARLPDVERLRWPHHRCCFARGPDGVIIPWGRKAQPAPVVEGDVGCAGAAEPPSWDRAGIRAARLALGESSSAAGERAVVSGPVRLVKALRPPLPFPSEWLPHLLPPVSDRRVRLRDEEDVRDLWMHAMHRRFRANINKC